MRLLALMLCVLLASPLAFVARADDDDDDHDRARAALERGDILPLAHILQIVRDNVGGRVIEVDLDEDDGIYIYEIEVVMPDGRILKVEIDAATGRILKIEEDD